MKTDNLITMSFDKARQHAEAKAMFDLDDQWCVCIRYGAFGAFPLSFALGREYAIICVTIY
jgi:hypothetical protein